MRRMTTGLLAIVAVLPLTVAAAPVTNVDDPICDASGRELLTTDGFELTFDAPAVTAPEYTATGDVTGDAVTHYRTAEFWFAPRFGVEPGTEVDTTFELSWGGPGDFDIFLFDHEGYEIGRAAEDQVQGDQTVTTESVTIGIEECLPFQVAVRSFAGSPADQLTLTITPDAEAATAKVTDDRRTLYLSGDRPGQVTTLHGATFNADTPLQTRFSDERPTTGQPNTISRPVLGSRIERNLFQPFWTGILDDEPNLVGDASALVWVSSPTMAEAGGTLYVELFVDGAQVGEYAIDGGQVRPEPTPVLARFPDLDIEEAYQVTFQVTALPIVSPNEQSENPGDVTHTVYYDSVQFQSRIFLPIAPPPAP